MRRFIVLDSFRGICALCVVFHHFNVRGSITEWGLFRNATFMVEFFFVLSGFVLTHAYSKRDFDFAALKKFAITRTFRLFPLHIIMLIVFIFLELAKLIAQSKGIDFNKPAFSGVNAPMQILPNILLLQSWLTSAATLSFNYPSWSISVEYYLYAIFAIVLLFAQKTKCSLIAIFLIISCVGFLGLLAPVLLLLKTEALSGLACFFGGAITYMIYAKSHPEKLSRLAFSILEVISILICYYSVTLSYEYKDIFTSVVFCATIYIFSFEIGVLSTVLKRAVFEFFGKISFSIYMTHAAVIFVAVSLAMGVEKLLGYSLTYSVTTKTGSTLRYIDLGNVLYNNVFALSLLAVIIAVSYVSYNIIEVRSISAGKKYTKNKMTTTQ
ncbi:TPA: acyltransferase family protein [Serratia odorifera]|nr:acyltransferase [Serratia odorifera]